MRPLPRLSPLWAVLASLWLTAVVGAQEAAPAASPLAPVAAAPAVDAAATPASPYAPEWPEPPSPLSLLLRLLFGTVVVLGACVATLFFGKKWLNPVPSSKDALGSLKLVESVSLGNRCAVHLLQIGNARVLAGVDHTGLQSLIELNAPFDDLVDERLRDELPNSEPADNAPAAAA